MFRYNPHPHFPIWKRKQDVPDVKHFSRRNTGIIWSLFYSQYNAGTTSAGPPHHKRLHHGAGWPTRSRKVQSRQDVFRLHPLNRNRKGFLRHHADLVPSGARASRLEPVKLTNLERDLVTSRSPSERLKKTRLLYVLPWCVLHFMKDV